MVAMLRPVQPYVEYLLNQDYISEFLCVNKDQPKLQCNGKCYLVKQLEKQQKKEPLSALSISLENYPIGFVTIYRISAPQKFPLADSPHYSYRQFYNFDFHQNNFHPPDLV